MVSFVPSQTSPEEPITSITAGPTTESNAPSAVSELQEAFSSILLACREKSDYVSIWDKHLYRTNQAIKYKWTGAFELFAFPRELRDRIYYHYLYLPGGLTFNRNTSRRFPYEEPEVVTNLFLASKQVYDEAFQVFCRYNEIQIASSSYNTKSVIGTLRLFPKGPAKMLQRVSKRYSQPVGYYYNSGSRHAYTSPGENLVTMMRDAYTFKFYFPRLREFTAIWEVYPDGLAEFGLRFENKTEEEKVETWLEFMRHWIQTKNAVPPTWLRFEFRNNWRKHDMQPHQASMQEAYTRLLRETAPFRDDQKELEEAERRCAEEMSSVDNKKQRKKDRRLQGTV